MGGSGRRPAGTLGVLDARHRRRTVHPRESDRRSVVQEHFAELTVGAKEVRQFGFDISGFDVSYAAGDSLGVYPTNDPASVDDWLAATGMHGEHTVVVDGAEQSMREALTSRYDFCRVTPDLLRFITENCRDAKALRARKDKLDKWLVGRNGLDLVQEFVVHADPDQWLEVLVRLTPRNYSISSSPLVSPHEVQLTVSVVRYRGADGGRRGECARPSSPTVRRRLRCSCNDPRTSGHRKTVEHQ